MRHRVKGRGFGRNPSHRRAMLKNMVTSLLDKERIETTDEKAKEARSIAERIITLGKRGDLHARRRALRTVRSREVVAKVFSELAERFRERQGGYTRITKIGHRPGDGAMMSILELIPSPTKAVPGKRTRRLRKKKEKETALAPEAAAALEAEEKAEAKKEPAAKKEKAEKKAPPKKAAPKKEAPEKAKAKAKKEPEKPAKAKKAEEKPKAAEKKPAAKKKAEKAETKPAKSKPKK